MTNFTVVQHYYDEANDTTATAGFETDNLDDALKCIKASMLSDDTSEITIIKSI